MTEQTDGADETRIAIACQGGGSLTAYTAGVLQSLLDGLDGDERIVGFSGTSGGAICATLAWYGLLTDGPEQAIEDLDAFWRDIAARGPLDSLVNEWSVRFATLEESNVSTPEISPYHNPFAAVGQRQLKSAIETYVDFDRIAAFGEHEPRLFVGATNVSTDEFTVFHGSDLTAEKVLASTALPRLFPAVEVDGEMYWDGMFSENPPIRELVSTDPDELWIVQVNPQRIDSVPRTTREIVDRRDELSGNLSLNQELSFVQKINDLIDDGIIDHEGYKHIDIHRIVIDGHYGYASKLDRNAGFIDSLIQNGLTDGEHFLDARV